MARQSVGEETGMEETHFLFRTLVWTCLLFFASVGALPGAENAPPNSTARQELSQKLDYPNSPTVEYPALIPLSGYTSDKGKALARKHRPQLIQIIHALEKTYPLSQMEIRAVGFLKSPQCGQKDDRYLSVIMEVSEEYDPGKAAMGKRSGAVFNKYVESVAKILLKSESILEDKDVEGIAICPNWMLKRTKEASPAAAMSEGMFVCINKRIGKEFFHGKIDLAQLATKATIYARQGDKISALTNIQTKEK
jgi:hypothetical protein